MDVTDPFGLEVAATLAARRREALLPEVFALRVLRAELAETRPGLLRERIDGWRDAAADRFGDRMRDLAAALDEAARELADAERLMAEACERLAAEEASARHAAATPHDAVSTAGAGTAWAGTAPWTG
ncbi:hypothetical protein [Agromyces tropicus]|uniref:hypothetical protein n=1 Tax=Agromyces tropicus TaxID=555371 RepID=UPI0031D72D28